MKPLRLIFRVGKYDFKFVMLDREEIPRGEVQLSSLSLNSRCRQKNGNFSVSVQPGRNIAARQNRWIQFGAQR